MSTIGWVIVIVIGLVVLGLVVNRQAMQTLWFNIRSAFGSSARTVDSHNAVANMRQAVEDAKSEISRHTAKLNKSQGQINSLTRDAKDAASEVAVLTTRVQYRAAQVNGNTDDPVLLDLADQLSKAQTKAADATNELAQQTALHNQVLEQVKDAVITADKLEQSADRMGVKLDLSSSRAELASVGINFSKSSAHAQLDRAKAYEKDIQNQIDTNNGTVEVAKQLNPHLQSSATAAWIAKQDAKDTLAKLGIGTPASTPDKS